MQQTPTPLSLLPRGIQHLSLPKLRRSLLQRQLLPLQHLLQRQLKLQRPTQ
jgi:hypothetical protein